MIANVVSNMEELKQVMQLSHFNHKSNVSTEEKMKEGFISWHYSFELLNEMHKLQPSVIVKDNDKVIAYALVALKEASNFHPDLAGMIKNLESIRYQERLLSNYTFYVMGQVCVDKAYRGKGVFEMLYLHHKKLFENRFDFVVTEISSSNHRSMRAHEKVGFKTVYTYKDATDEWNVVLWNWQ